MKRILTILSFVPALISGVLCTVGSGGEFFHLVWLMVLSGAFAGILHSPVFLLWYPASAALSMAVSTIITEKLYPPMMYFLFIAAIALFAVLGYGIGAFVSLTFRGKTAQRIGAGFGALLLLVLLFVPYNALFGNPVSALIAKHQLDECMEKYVDPEQYDPEDFLYDWYDGHYLYHLRDRITGERKTLTLRNNDTIYFSGTKRVYENIWN